jgi:coenzyme Q-binding protein COQ10
VAEFMIKAFEKRVQELLRNNPDMVRASLAELDGSRLKR